MSHNAYLYCKTCGIESDVCLRYHNEDQIDALRFIKRNIEEILEKVVIEVKILGIYEDAQSFISEHKDCEIVARSEYYREGKDNSENPDIPICNKAEKDTP